MSEIGENGLIALSGPSGVGKGYTKSKIEQFTGVSFAEPVVVSTRHARIDDGPSRMAGISERDFDRLVASGEVTLPHRPFRLDITPRYAFLTESLISDKPILTEVHASIIDVFKERFQKSALVIGMVASRETLADNIMERQGSEFDGVGIDLRVDSAAQEAEEIFDAYRREAIDALFSMDIDERDRAVSEIVAMVRNYLEGHPWTK